MYTNIDATPHGWEAAKEGSEFRMLLCSVPGLERLIPGSGGRFEGEQVM